MTREEAISKINNDLEWHKKELSAAYKTALNMAIEALKFQEVYDVTIKAVNKYYDEHRAQILCWIPCSERLPDRNGEYLVTTKEGEVYQDTLQFLCQWDDCGDDVIAWMPLPTPYQEDK